MFSNSSGYSEARAARPTAPRAMPAGWRLNSSSAPMPNDPTTSAFFQVSIHTSEAGAGISEAILTRAAREREVGRAGERDVLQPEPTLRCAQDGAPSGFQSFTFQKFHGFKLSFPGRTPFSRILI